MEKTFYKKQEEEKKKLNQIEFIKTFFANPEHFDKTVLDLHEALRLTFQTEYRLTSHITLYDYLEEIKISYKKIIYKNNLANTPRVNY